MSSAPAVSTDCDAPAVAHSIIGRVLPFQVRAGQATLAMAWGALHGTRWWIFRRVRFT